MRLFVKTVVVTCLFCGMAFAQFSQNKLDSTIAAINAPIDSQIQWLKKMQAQQVQASQAQQFKSRSPETTPSALSVAQTSQEQQSAQNWVGDGGEGMSITIYALQPVGFEIQTEFLALIQKEFVGIFSTYSAISVLDWENLDNILVKLTHGVYDENAEVVKNIGHFTPTTHYLTGKITKTELGYHLQINITKTADKTIAASYAATVVVNRSNAMSDPLIGGIQKDIRLASCELLQNMGVTLTEKGLVELTGQVLAKHQKAQRDAINAIAGAQYAHANFQSQSYEAAIANLEAEKKERELQIRAMMSNVDAFTVKFAPMSALLKANPSVAVAFADAIQKKTNQTNPSAQHIDASARVNTQIEQFEKHKEQLCIPGKNYNGCDRTMRTLGTLYCYQDHIRAGHELKPGSLKIDHTRAIEINQRLLREYPIYKNLPPTVFVCPYCGTNTNGQKP